VSGRRAPRICARAVFGSCPADFLVEAGRLVLNWRSRWSCCTAYTRDLWPRSGRILITACTTTFEQFGKAIDDAFAPVTTTCPVIGASRGGLRSAFSCAGR
jgi:hypothetical protein